MSWLFCVGIGKFSRFPTDRIYSFSSLICVHYHNVRPTMRAAQLTEKKGVAWAVWLHHHRLFELSHYLPDRITLSPWFEHLQTIINFNKTSNWNNHRTKLWNCHLVPFVRQKIVFQVKFAFWNVTLSADEGLVRVRREARSDRVVVGRWKKSKKLFKCDD